MAKWTDDPIVVIGDDGPVMGVVLARGLAAATLFASGLTLSKARLPEYRRVGKEWRRVRVRVFNAFGDEARFWISGGYYTWTRGEWIALWCRAMLDKGRVIPRAIIVRRQEQDMGMKCDEISKSTSCFNIALPSERMFVLLARDICAPVAIRAWVQSRLDLGKNEPSDPQIVEALDCADAMDKERAIARSSAGLKP